MNIIRTTAVELSTIPAIAYKQKLASGGAGLKLHRTDINAEAVFTVDRRGDAPVPYGKVDEALFPEEAATEALELTIGLPYSARGKIKVTVVEEAQAQEPEDVTEEDIEDVDMVDSNEYNAVIERYTDEKGKLNYQLMNKDFIQFAAKSKSVANLVEQRVAEDDVLLHIVKSRAGLLANSKETLTDAQATALIETLDEINPRSAFKELKSYIRRQLARK